MKNFGGSHGGHSRLVGKTKKLVDETGNVGSSQKGLKPCTRKGADVDAMVGWGNEMGKPMGEPIGHCTLRRWPQQGKKEPKGAGTAHKKSTERFGEKYVS